MVDLRLAKLAATTVQAFRVADDALIPLSAFFELSEIKHDSVRSGRLTAILQPGNKQFVADAAQGIASAGSTRLTPGVRGLRAEGDEVYLSAAALADLVGVAFRIDWAELSVNVDEPAMLPVASRLARTGDRAARLRAAADAQLQSVVDATRGMSRPLLDGAVLDYSVTLPADQPLKKGSYAVQVGADLLGGALQSDVSGTDGFVGLGIRATTSWTGVWRNSRLVKVGRLGSTITTGLGPQAIIGATLTNAPYVRAASFGILEFPGQVGPHWEVEVYRDGLLVAVDSTDSRGRFHVPLEVRYGTNLVRFVAYGPNGEERNFTGTFLLVDNLIPYHHFEYAASAGRCTGTSCSGAANFDMRYGILKTWTVRAGLDGFMRDVGSSPVPVDTSSRATLDSARRVRDTTAVSPALPVVPASSARLSRAYASISGNPFNALNVTAGITQHTSTNIAFQYEPNTTVNLVGSRTSYPTPLTDALLGVQGVMAEERVSGYWRPFGERRSLYVEGSDVLRHTMTETQISVRSSLSFEKWYVRFSPFLVRETQNSKLLSTTTNGFGVSAFVPPMPQLGSFLGKFSFRPALESRSGTGVDVFSLGFSRSLGDTRLDGSFSRTPIGGNSLAMSVSTDLSRVRVGSTISASRESNTVSEFVQGSILLDRAAHAATFYKGPSLGRSGVAGRVFLDANGDGVMNDGDEPLANVSVKVGSAGAQTDSLGRYSVWDIPSFEPVTVQLDTSSFSNPIYTPAVSTISVQPGPHRFEPVNFAVVVGGTVEGRVVRSVADGPPIPVPGATVIFTDAKTHAERSVDTFSDGSFNVTGIRPGTYNLTIDAATLEVLKGKSGIVPVTVKPSADGSIVKGIELIVRVDAAHAGS